MAFGLSGGHRVEQHETLTHSVTALTIDAGAGDVTVRSGAKAGTVEVTSKSPSTWVNQALGHEAWQGNTLAIDPGCDCGVDYEIRVPDGVAVTAHTGSGDIELGGTLGPVSLEAGSGDVDGDLTTSSLVTHTGSGDVDLRLRTPPTQLSADTGSGDVSLRVPNGEAYAVDSETSSGEEQIDVSKDDASEHRLQVRTGSGDIRLRTS